jgi:hypothetical protein
MPTPREKVYDEQISPLVAQILEICYKNRVPVLMDFDISGPDKPNFACTSALLKEPVTDEADDESNHIRKMRQCSGYLTQGSTFESDKRAEATYVKDDE